MPKLARARAVHAEAAHQRLGAVIAGAHRDAVAVQQGRDVMRVGALHREAEHAAAVLRLAEHAQALDLRQPGQRMVGQRRLVRRDGVEADRLHVVDRRAEADRLQDRRRAGLELVRHLGPGGALEADRRRSCRRRP